MDKEYLEIAAKMLYGKYDTQWLDHNLCVTLNKVNDLLERVGGKLKSRQVIATIIVQWLSDNPSFKGYN